MQDEVSVVCCVFMFMPHVRVKHNATRTRNASTTQARNRKAQLVEVRVAPFMLRACAALRVRVVLDTAYHHCVSLLLRKSTAQVGTNPFPFPPSFLFFYFPFSPLLLLPSSKGSVSL